MSFSDSSSGHHVSFRQRFFPIDAHKTAVSVRISPQTNINANVNANVNATTVKNAKNATSLESSNSPRVKTRYEIWREKKNINKFRSSLSDTHRSPVPKGSLRFAIGESLDMSTIAALELTLEEGNQDQDTHDIKKAEGFDLAAFLSGPKKTKSALRHIKANYIEELKERIEERGSVQDGLSKEECLYYIETFVSIDVDMSGAITEDELFQAMDTMNMGVTLEKVREMIKSVDVNGDGDVSVDEFLKLMANMRTKMTFLQSPEQLQLAFSLVDRDSDGFIGLQDLVTLFEELGDKEVDFGTCKKMLHAVLGDTHSSSKSDEPKVGYAGFVKLVKAIGQ